MKEILAENLQSLFDNTSLIGVKTYSGKTYEVWQVPDYTFESMCNMGDEEFEKLCPEGMWRCSDGSNMGYPHDHLTVNKKKLRCWDEKENSYRNQKCESLLNYLCNNVGASQPKNVCALAVDFAKYNGCNLRQLAVADAFPSGRPALMNGC